MELKKLPHLKHLKLVKDYVASATIVKLQYVTDKDSGIIRIKKGKGFAYHLNNKLIREKDALERIRKLVIPPAWKNVWICSKPNGHIQVTGYDARNRKQYRYHTLWNALRNETKFHKMIEFGKVLPKLRLQVEKDLALKELTEQKVIATVIGLMERTYIRIGNSAYEKENGSYGLTTMHDKHVTINGSKITFTFKGKKSVHHTIQLTNKKLAQTVKQCRDIPGKELFQYYTTDGQINSIDSGMVNAYIKSITGEEYTAKDFRTWAGSLHALSGLAAIGKAITATEAKQNINKVVELVSTQLGNTKTVCKKYYIHPSLLRSYEERELDKYLDQLETIEINDAVTGLTKLEQALIFILSRIH